MDDIVAWRSPCLEHKWRDGKGMIFLRGIEYYKEQAVELHDALQQLIGEMKDEEERKQRRESGERDTR